MRILVLLAAVLVALDAAACASAPPSPEGQVAPDRLYRSKCSACHRPYDPASRTRAQWREALGKMAPKAHLDPGEKEAIGGFLAAHASDAGGGGGGPPR